MKYITQKEFAANAGVTPQNVTYLIKHGKLNIEDLHGKKLIKIDKKYQDFVASYKPNKNCKTSVK